MSATDTAALPRNVDLDAERLVLGQILDWPEAFGLYAEAGLATTDFARQVHVWVYAAACDVAADGLEVGQPTISRRLREQGRWDEVGSSCIQPITPRLRTTSKTSGPLTR